MLVSDPGCKERNALVDGGVLVARRTHAVPLPTPMESELDLAAMLERTGRVEARLPRCRAWVPVVLPIDSVAR